MQCSFSVHETTKCCIVDKETYERHKTWGCLVAMELLNSSKKLKDDKKKMKKKKLIGSIYEIFRNENGRV